MRWYSRLSSIRTAADQPPAQPPAYVEERVSDLEYAQEFLFKNPAQAKKILAAVAEQISQHHDDKFLEPIRRAAELLSNGNPRNAHEMIEATKQAMIAERKMKEAEDRNPWKKPSKKP